MQKPKIRELAEAIRAVFSHRFTSRFPKEEADVASSFRGAPDYQDDGCIGCSGCYNVCPADAIDLEDSVTGTDGIRHLRVNFEECIYCGQCEKYCTTGEGIELSQEYSLAFVGDEGPSTSTEKDLVICDACGEVLGTKDHVLWLYSKLGNLAYSNPSIFLTYLENLDLARRDRLNERPSHRSDRVRVLCPECRRELTIIEQGEES
ncbi:MAG: 4Fe-4S dicluster domain-containing protein [Candidatus Bipolaricaulia bacterium]